MKAINVIGLGYIGLPTALILAKSGLEVVGTDYNENLVQRLSQGELTFREEGLEVLFEKARENGIQFSTEYLKTSLYILSVPTPFIRKSKKIDTAYLIKAVNNVLDVCEKGTIMIMESTVSPGTIDTYVRPEIMKRDMNIGEDVHLVHAPERIIPGNMIFELEHNARTIGADSMDIAEIVKKIYSSFCKGEIVLTDIRSAEMSKVVENTYRDINIAFANELAQICRNDHMDVYEIIRIANKHPRVNILQPGPGVGGHCISVDPWFLVGDYPELTSLVHAARDINDAMPEFVRKRMLGIMKEKKISSLKKVGLYGLTYKENVDDTRESPTLQLIEILEENLNHGIRIYDPHVRDKMVEGQVMDFEAFLSGLEMIVIMVGHDHLRNHLDRLKGLVVFDTKNVTGLEDAELL
ncbi:nucleotide sugar dehydrogenase [Proteiniclasticum sp. SCR006]|uniref:Nucleotide sugar dehydrogenase n=1 Tax=Proteiniclasticum aestuarii TaxID=2817862 RepID=A0A939HFE6_9CLOT|nr:nucleotide sugar dehydrogenase [Proteiniclasticum aestuarii]MBO1266318.1 nucleotide sugar dehydrogenase [Proteiniclasticum aestuarii]